MHVYSTYKESGYKWIGQIPNDWEIYPAKYIFTENKNKNYDGSVTNSLKFRFGKIVPKANFDAESDEYVADTITSYTVVEPDTIIVNGLNLNYDFKSMRVGIVKEKGVITSAYLAVVPNKELINPCFANYLLKGYEARMAFHNMGTGLRLTLGFKEFKNQPIVLPDRKTQDFIVEFLNKQIERIDSLIEEAKESIEEYKSWKASIIYEAVTKGLDPNVEMKDSGVEWLGRIPSVWSLRKIKNIATTGSGGTPKSDVLQYYDGNINWVCSFDLHEDRIVKTKKTLSELGLQNCASEIRPKGTVVMAMYGGSGTIGNSGILDQPCATNQAICCIMFANSILPDYGFYYIRAIRPHWMVYAVGTRKDPNISQSIVAEMPIVVPSIEEQEKIVQYLHRKIKVIEALIVEKEHLIADLESYKKSLIYEVVTGKRKVV